MNNTRNFFDLKTIQIPLHQVPFKPSGPQNGFWTKKYSLQEKMNFPNIGALDIRCACTGFIYALSIADQYIKTKTYHNILVIASEVQSTSMDLSNTGRDTAIYDFLQ